MAVVPVRTRTVARKVETVAEARPVRESMVGSDTLGLVTEMAREGTRLEEGEVLCRLDDERARAALEAAETRLASARADHDLARRDLERAENLAAEGVRSRVELDRARTAVEAARAALEAARSERERARVEMERRTVTAPFAGTVLERRVEVGEVVNPGGTLCRFADLSVLEVTGWVDARHGLHVVPGQRATVLLEGTGASVEVEVHRVGPGASPDARTLEVVCRLPNPDGLPPGLTGRLRLDTERREGVPAVPHIAVDRGPDGALVWLVEDGRARRRLVETGLEGADAIEVTGGLEPGDRVVVRGGEDLADGEAVSTAPASADGPPTDRGGGS